MSKKISINGSKLIKQGSYGCIYYPSITCSGTSSSSTNKKKFATKIQKSSFNTINEINIGKMIMNIPNYNYYFVPVIKNCPIKLKALHAKQQEQELSKCKIISEKDNNINYILMTMPYISNKSFYSIFSNTKNKNINKNIIPLIDTFNTLLDAISILLKNNIVHFDLKVDNILYNTELNIVQMIDFGISIPIDKLTTETIKDYFYIYAPDYYVWSFEIHVINFLIHKLVDTDTDIVLTKEHVTQIVNDVVKYNKVLETFFKDKDVYKNSCITFLTTYIGINKYTIINELLKTYETWDKFSLCILYLDVLNMNTIYFGNTSFISEFSQLLMRNILPNSISVKETKSRFNSIQRHIDLF